MKNYEGWAFNKGIIVGRIIGLLLLASLWLQSHDNKAGVVLLLFLIIMTLARWRFNLPGWTVLIDQVACFIVIPFWSEAIIGIALPIFEAMVKGKILYVLPGLIGVILFGVQTPYTLGIISFLIFALYSGWLLCCWSNEVAVYREASDRERRERYELETLKGELLSANSKVARMAELNERNRISQQLHDNVGHELTAAVLALQAFEQLWGEDDRMAQDMFQQAQKRLSNSAKLLRETVHNMRPNTVLGIDELKIICGGFKACPIDFNVFGDTSRIPVHVWGVLQPCLKEALTNSLRHAKPNYVKVSLDVNPHIVRLSVVNDGVKNLHTIQRNEHNYGTGIRNLRQRAKTIGGSLSTATAADKYTLICVLPLNEKDF